MFEETPYLQPQPGTDGSHQAWPTAPEAHTHAPVETEKETDATAARAEQNADKSEGVLCTFAEVSFSMTVRRERGDGLPTVESGMKEVQYPYRVLFSTRFTTASRQCSAP